MTAAADRRCDRVTPLVCEGDHTAMGAAQGRAYRDALRSLDRALMELAGASGSDRGAGRVPTGAWRMLVPAVGGVARRVMARDLLRHYPRQYDRMVGIARAARVPLSWLFVGPGIELALNRVSYVVPPAACTAVAVTGARARRGEPMIAKNFDYPDAARDAYLVRVSRPTRRGLAASIDVTAAPLPGAHEGINEHGLAIAYNYGHFSGRSGARVSITNLVQEVLEHCRTVDDAIEHVRRRPRAGSAIWMVADAAGHIAAVEIAPDAVAVRRGEALAQANHALSDEMRPRDIPHDAVLSRWNPKAVRGRRVHASSESRSDRAHALLADCGTASADDLKAMLADHGPAGEGDDYTICRHGPYHRTTSSVVLYPQRRTMEIMFGAPCEATYSLVAL